MRLLIAAATLFIPLIAFGHPGHDASGFSAGFFHPLLGLDHLLTAMAVGIWAAQSGQRSALAFLPAAFLVGVIAGGAQGILGHALPFYDQGILAALALIGLGLVAAVRLPVAQSAAIVALFGWIHGNAHGAEIGPSPAVAIQYSLGFLSATLALHAIGIAAALGLRVAYSGRATETFARGMGVVCLVVTGILWLG